MIDPLTLFKLTSDLVAEGSTPWGFLEEDPDHFLDVKNSPIPYARFNEAQKFIIQSQRFVAISSVR